MIFRGDAHPRVTRYDADQSTFTSLEKARNYIKKHRVIEPKKIFKEGAGETTPLPSNQAFYAVADSKTPSIYKYFPFVPILQSVCILLTNTSGEPCAESKVNHFSGSCHKAFRKRAQAEAFIEDWKDTYAELWRREIRNALDQGFRPEDMKVQVKKILSPQKSKDLSDKFSTLCKGRIGLCDFFVFSFVQPCSTYIVSYLTPTSISPKDKPKQMPQDYIAISHFVKVIAKDFAGPFCIFTQLLQIMEESDLILSSPIASPSN